MKHVLEWYLGSCARRAIAREKPRVIVVAGSVGKSSTKEAIAVAGGAYEPGSRALVSPKNYNNELGVPLTMFRMLAPGRSPFAWLRLLVRATLTSWGIMSVNASSLVLEFGTDRPGDLEYLLSIAKPDITVLTAIGAEHTEFLGDVERVAEEERSTIRALKPDGIAILNADDERVMHGKKLTSATVVTFGESPNADVRLVSAQLAMDEAHPEASGLDVHIVVLGLGARFRLRGVFGKPHALAVAASLALIHALDIDFHEAAERLKGYRGLPGRTRLVEGIKKTMLLDDTYNSSPLAALSAVRDLASYPLKEGAKRIAALGDMLELGTLAESSHAQVGKAVAESGIDTLVACGTLAHVVADAAKQAGMPEGNVFTFAKSEEAGLFIQERLKSGDVVLTKGSQGSRMEKVTKELMAHPEHAEALLVRQTEEWE